MEILSTLSPANAVPSPKNPFITPAFPEINYINFPIVILEGNPWGFIIISGTIPD